MYPLMVSQKDDVLLGVAQRSDAMGTLAVWSARARDLVPHLTEQTTEIRGFQILAEAFRLWGVYQQNHPEHAGRVDDFFLLVEQAFARTVGKRDQAWRLPGARRVAGRCQEQPHISLVDTGWHLLGGQKANGLWGLYRGHPVGRGCSQWTSIAYRMKPPKPPTTTRGGLGRAPGESCSR